MQTLRRRGDRSPAHLCKLADEELMRLVASGDGDAFAIVLERHGDAAFSLAYRILGRRSYAEDVVQEAFLSVWRGGARYDPARASVRTWTLGIVHNRAIDMLRRNSPHDQRRAGGEDLAEQLPSAARTDLEVERRSEAREVRSALERLPAEQTRVIELAYFGGFTHTEIAGMLALPIGTVKGRMRLGLEKLRTEVSALRLEEASGEAAR
jgi:RNA polymerase sigma-70 factor (ECF subfamily)